MPATIVRRTAASAAIAVVGATAAFMGQPSAASASAPVTEITVSSPLAQPCNVQAAPDGSQWFIEHGARRLGRIDLHTGVIVTVDLPNVTVVPHLPVAVQLPGAFPIGPCDMTVPGDGNLWFNDQYNNAVGYLSLRPPYVVHEIVLPTPYSVPMSMATGADGNIYVTQTASNQIAEINPQTHAVSEISVPTPVSGIIGGVAGQDGAHWFVEIAANKLLRLDYRTHAIREYTVPVPAALPFVVRSYGGQIWFTESGADAIGHFDPATGRFSAVSLPTPASVPIGVTRGVDGFLYTDESVGNKIARIDPVAMKVVAEYPVPTPGAFPDEMKTGPDGAIWAPEFLAGKLVRLWLPAFGTDPGVPPVSGATTLAQDAARLLGVGP
jgi:virginiamycin B lyase